MFTGVCEGYEGFLGFIRVHEGLLGFALFFRVYEGCFLVLAEAHWGVLGFCFRLY